MANKLDEKNILEINVLKVRGNALIFGNTIYQISNITSVKLTETKKSYKNKSPAWIKIFFYLGAIFILLAFLIKSTSNDNLSADGNISIFFMVLSILSFLISYLGRSSHSLFVNDYTYGLKVTLSSGDYNKFISKDEDFIKEIVMSLYSVISDKNSNKSITYNFSENKVIVDSASSCNIVSGDIKGDVVNNI